MTEANHAKPTVRTAQPAELDQIAPAYAAAGEDEAVSAWVRAAEPHSPGIPAGLLREWLADALRTGEILVAEGPGGAIEGVSTWQWLDSPAPLQHQAAALCALARSQPGTALQRLATALQHTADHHPSTPHWYLASMAVLPHCRGRGIGGALLRHRLRQSDAEGHPTYLEASTTRSAALYARYGFLSTGTPIPLPDHGPRLQPMWREPRSARTPGPAT
ncbi:GNAT family N-acetyltransferase [Amycolatopsis anabasis]|uniref:GNAT family N-acetyltransferase n=1 Tax=Amycolatopsis anabasis TaxID=1840409 RepID=UPI00131B366C|nr:GNAT family N-acetyltransferase [Amycolatopsis anabasis]